MRTASHTANPVLLTASSALIYGLCSGIRANYGILLGPISQNSGVDYASVSLVLAVAQLFFGIMQPVFGVLAMKKSSSFVLQSGIALLTAGVLLLPFCRSLWTLMTVLGVLLPSCTAALSFSIVLGILTPQIPGRDASIASGVITASSGVGSTVLSPIIQALTAAVGLLGTMLFLGVPSLLLLPVSFYLCRAAKETAPRLEQQKDVRLTVLAREAIQNRDYRFLLTGFFTCGFHMAIIETHLFTQITTFGFSEQTAAYAFSMYGVATMIGSVISGALCGRFPIKTCWAGSTPPAWGWAFLALPKSLPAIYGFAALLGLTGNATVPPTFGLTERLFGAAKLAALFGIVFFSHQIGSFFSAWLGGVCLSAMGGYTAIWLADAAFSGMAAMVSWRIRV